ncbi:MAG: hypothetical protein V1845_04165, partial [bacterium]
VFFAGAILLIIRVIYLWFLLILAPLAWLAYILPVQRSSYTKWWSTFFNQAFFAPAYGLFLFIAVKTLIESGKNVSFASATTFNAGFVFNYIIVIGLLVAALYAAKSLGAVGASGLMGFAQGQANKAKKWAGKQAMRPVEYGADRARGLKDRVSAGISLKLGKFAEGQGMDKTKARLEARAERSQRQLAERKYIKRQQDIMEHMSDNTIIEKTNKGDLAATRVMLKRGLNNRRDAAGNALVNGTLAQKAEETLRKFNDRENLEKLLKNRVDAITDPLKLENAIAAAVQEGNLNLISSVALEDDRVVAAITKLSTPKQIEDLRSKSSAHKKALVDSLQHLAADPTNSTNKQVQYAYASQSGDLTYLTDPTMQGDWAKTAGADGLKRLQSFDPTLHAEIAKNISPNLLHGVFEKMEKGDAAKNLAAYLRSLPNTGPTAALRNIADRDPIIQNL